MDGIFKKGNVYVAVINKSERDDVDKDDMDTLIMTLENKYHNKYLYGGRVCIEKPYVLSSKAGEILLHLKVDGISIQQINCRDNFDCYLSDSLNLEKVIAFLNQMENLGIDSFLENYKAQLQQFKIEMEEKVEKMEQEQSVNYNEDRNESITSLKVMIAKLTCMIFCLLINMNAGLDNQSYTDAYNEIINLYF